VRYVPEWFPGGGFHKIAASFRALTEELRDEPMRQVEKTMVRELLDALLRALLIFLRLLGRTGRPFFQSCSKRSTRVTNEQKSKR